MRDQAGWAPGAGQTTARSRSPLSQPIPGHREVAPKQGRRRDRARTWVAGATAESAARPRHRILRAAAQRNKTPSRPLLPPRSNGTDPSALLCRRQRTFPAEGLGDRDQGALGG